VVWGWGNWERDRISTKKRLKSASEPLKTEGNISANFQLFLGKGGPQWSNNVGPEAVWPLKNGVPWCPGEISGLIGYKGPVKGSVKSPTSLWYCNISLYKHRCSLARKLYIGHGGVEDASEKKCSRLAIARHISWPLINYAINSP